MNDVERRIGTARGGRMKLRTTDKLIAHDAIIRVRQFKTDWNQGEHVPRGFVYSNVISRVYVYPESDGCSSGRVGRRRATVAKVGRTWYRVRLAQVWDGTRWFEDGSYELLLAYGAKLPRNLNKGEPTTSITSRVSA